MALAQDLYLDLMEQCLLNLIYEDLAQDPWSGGTFNRDTRINGKDWPSVAHSMIGLKRIHNLRNLCEDVIARNIPGDFIETGIWRGGSCIMMRAVLRAHEDTSRRVWCADSFEGLPPPSENYPQDAGDNHSSFDALRISIDQVKSNFQKYDLLDEQVHFLEGWFKDTLHTAPISQLAILRLDGDMYESTMDAIVPLYDKVSPGGYIIVDDWFLPPCQTAINDFRQQRNITDIIIPIDDMGVYWQKTA